MAHQKYPKSTVQPPTNSQYILIIDDSQVIDVLLETVLTQQGYHVVTTSNLHDGMKQLEQQRFDLIILDLKLPDGNGLDLLQQIQDTPNNGVRVVTLSGMHQQNIIERAFALGAADYVVKPFDLDDLMMRINLFLSHNPELT